MTNGRGLRLTSGGGEGGGLDDAALVAAFQADPQGAAGLAAASTLLQRYRDRVHTWCTRRLGDPDAALDVTQEALLAALAALPGFGGRAQFSSWLFAIARNRCISALRARPRATGDDGGLADMADGLAGPQDRLLARESQELVLELMNQVLDAEERTALWLRAYEEMPVEEISRLLGLPGPSGARAVLQRARRRLRAAYDARHASRPREDEP
ncbi:MAG: sigma-70 family RNA polymerase sigma factor [bacterium]|nr:sigma-70 family RNA polymerase sigma factor [bacterium]